MGASQGAAAGAPWWLTICLPILTAVIAHHLTLHRERQKSGRDWQQRWLDDAKKLISKISDSAVSHYVDSGAIVKTPVSASLIISDIKRLGGLLREASCLDPSHAKLTFDALAAFNDSITAPDDFQDASRQVRDPNDGLCTRIQECEQALLVVIQKPRKKRD
ncbi:hypothetical protein H9L17_15440 [Thermomonas brevis]|uniref:Uncharacterized protein n=1 Tax=Thermomonas brevis TaxID=215691 RepID=A0A7G9QT56_9GAMM|nr:hypothetical protein [Thermomonas brevis]QNN46531.1 hypothetical protein H9L17_15440 [Thermomonas brevis]